MDLPASVIVLLTLVWVAVTGSGAVLLLLALRGRCVDRLARCRRCRYVMTGGMHDPTTCSECGADLREPGSLRFGRRRFLDETQTVFGVILVAAGVTTAVAVATRSGPAITTVIARVPGALTPITANSGANANVPIAMPPQWVRANAEVLRSLPANDAQRGATNTAVPVQGHVPGVLDSAAAHSAIMQQRFQHVSDVPVKVDPLNDSSIRMANASSAQSADNPDRDSAAFSVLGAAADLWSLDDAFVPDIGATWPGGFTRGVMRASDGGLVLPDMNLTINMGNARGASGVRVTPIDTVAVGAWTQQSAHPDQPMRTRVQSTAVKAARPGVGRHR